MKALSIFGLAIFLVIGFTSCDKEDTLVSPGETSPTQSLIGTPGENLTDIQAATISSSALDNLIEIESNVTFTVQESEDGSFFDLRGEGTGVSAEMEECLVLMQLRVDALTGSTRGTVIYKFEENGVTYRFRLDGNLNNDASNYYSVLNTQVVLMNSTNVSLSSGGKTYVFGDIFNLMQANDVIEATVVTKVLL